MKTIMLTGGGDLGKSTTLKHLYENYLLKDDSTQQIMREDFEESIDFYATFPDFITFLRHHIAQIENQ